MKNLPPIFFTFFTPVVIVPPISALLSFFVGVISSPQKWIKYKKISIPYFYVGIMILCFFISLISWLILDDLSILLYCFLKYKIIVLPLFIFVIFLTINFYTSRNLNTFLSILFFLFILVLPCFSQNCQEIFYWLLLVLSCILVPKSIFIIFDEKFSCNDGIPKNIKYILIYILYALLLISLYSTKHIIQVYAEIICVIISFFSQLVFMHKEVKYIAKTCSITHSAGVETGIDLRDIECNGSYILITSLNSKKWIDINKINFVSFYGDPFIICNESYSLKIFSWLKKAGQTGKVLFRELCNIFLK